ncbi:MAG: glycoside hydrolase family 99-like domain-containing protein [Kiritimatiellae bacterium]|nr:glycoside hydrolase family 99-like domain-containing protein [Kiritimatiellia bacterium]
MKTAMCALCAALAGLAFGAAAEYDVAAYVWPAYQPEPRWKELGIFGDGKGEWQNLYEATKRQACDNQGVRPLWGYEDESNPVVVARKIDAATASGVNVFIYDWYWYGGRPFLEDALDKGFLGAKNCGRMKFFVMWANHDVNGLWNNKMSTADGKNDVIWPAKVSDDDFAKIVDRWMTMYFSRPNYYRIGGKPVLSIYDIKGFVDWEGLDKAKKRLSHLRDRAKSAGFPGVHLQVVGGYFMASLRGSLAELGVDSFTSYSWNDGTWNRINDRSKPECTYPEWSEMSFGFWDRYRDQARGFGAVFFPNITVGWDTNARYPVAETRRIVRNPNPADFERAARRVKAWADATIPASMPKLITVNSWNEWTEGSYLEPDDRFGYGFLDAIRAVFLAR